jgi:hypothetical protein
VLGAEVARTASRQPTELARADGRSVGAWTERAPNLRGREGVKNEARGPPGELSAKMLRL